MPSSVFSSLVTLAENALQSKAPQVNPNQTNSAFANDAPIEMALKLEDLASRTEGNVTVDTSSLYVEITKVI